MRFLLAIAVLAAATIATTGCAFKVAGPCKSVTHSCQNNSCTLHVEDKCFGWLRRGLLGTNAGCREGACESPIQNLRNGAPLASVSVGTCGNTSCNGGCGDPGCGSMTMPAMGSLVSAPAGCGDCGGGGCSNCPTPPQGPMVGVYGGAPNQCGGCAGQGCSSCKMGMPLPSFGTMFGRGPVGCGTAGCGTGGQPCSTCQIAGPRMGMGGMPGSLLSAPCGVSGCGLGGQFCSSCSAEGAGGGDGCGKFGCGTNGKHCLACKLGGGGLKGKLHSGRLKSRIGHPYGNQFPHTPGTPGMGGPQMGGPGSAPSYAYPYYTTRGPRDFLRDNPPSIGW